jgi:NAD(P)-dependent dehydrogenase (short-subunit alcohol dehydrogenase family)
MGDAAIVTGGSRGLGRALAAALAARGWGVVIDARGEAALAEAARELGRLGRVRAVPGDVADPGHRRALLAAAEELGALRLVVHNASALGPSPLPAVAELAEADLLEVLRVNALAPLALTRLALPRLRAAGGRLVFVTSDAAVERYAGWGGYGAAKAAMERLALVLGEEEPGVRVYVADPGDMRTEMHQAAFPGEDISDRPPPEASVPGLLRLVEGDLPSGRYVARELAPAVAAR